MSDVLKGRPVFDGRVIGNSVCLPLVDASPLPTGSILIAPYMSTDVALTAIEHRAVGVVTEAGSFACHGANLIRTAVAQGSPAPIWTTDVIGSNQIASGLSVEINGSTITIADGPARARIVRGPAASPMAPQRGLEVVRETLLGEVIERCYWPHRSYDKLTADIMTSGLIDSIESLVQIRPNIRRSAHGQLWFSASSPSIEALESLACKLAVGERWLDRQTDTYHQILDGLRSDPSLNDLLSMLHEYFTVFMLFHNTYESVLIRADRALARELDATACRMLLESTMTSLLLRWQVEHGLALVNAKDLFSNDFGGPLPPFSPSEDVSSTWSLLEASATVQALSPRLRSLLRYTSRVVVVKEWKFFVNKALFSAFARRAAGLAAAAEGSLTNVTAWRSLSTKELTTALERTR
jgi:hypothetical protein